AIPGSIGVADLARAYDFYRQGDLRAVPSGRRSSRGSALVASAFSLRHSASGGNCGAGAERVRQVAEIELPAAH
ncbi:MAG: hypothetical protein ACRDOI_34665, partial [Trebonia sp.]